ncbi:GPI-anchored surface protein, putative, partial [Bodo saltans]
MTRLLVWAVLLIVMVASVFGSTTGDDLNDDTNVNGTVPTTPQLGFYPWLSLDGWAYVFGAALDIPVSLDLPLRLPKISQPLNINSLPPIAGVNVVDDFIGGANFSFDDVHWDVLDIQNIELLVAARNSSQLQWDFDNSELRLVDATLLDVRLGNISVKTQPTAFSVTPIVMGTSVTCHGKMV